MILEGSFLQAQEVPGAGDAQDKTARDSLADIEFSLQWKSKEASHTDVNLVQNINLWRDWMPPEVEQLLSGKARGFAGSIDLDAGVLVPDGHDVLEVPLARFNRQHRKTQVVEPRAGRFYPKGFIAGVRDIYSEDFTPFRLGRVDSETLTVDLGHPLAGKALRLSANIIEIRRHAAERGGRAQDIPQLVAGNGPGMQARWQGQPTDFFGADAFKRDMEGADDLFYAKPRFVDHLDSLALLQLKRLYERVLPRQGRILDLMASFNSHLERQDGRAVAGLGMNEDELAANELLCERRVRDLNMQPELPWDDQSFDAAICSLSVEYLVNPDAVFSEIARVLKPGGIFMVAFSNRWFPPKAIRIWSDLHPFERMGLVLELFLRNGRFVDLQTFSLTGLPRPQDDKYAAQMLWSDPIYAVWGRVV